MNSDPGPGDLSKSRYMAGLQCELRLWQKLFHPERAVAPDAADSARRAEGTEVGRLAHTLFRQAHDLGQHIV